MVFFLDYTIFSKVLTLSVLSVATHSSSAEILMCQLYVHLFCFYHGNHKFYEGLAKNQLF